MTIYAIMSEDKDFVCDLYQVPGDAKADYYGGYHTVIRDIDDTSPLSEDCFNLYYLDKQTLCMGAETTVEDLFKDEQTIIRLYSAWHGQTHSNWYLTEAAALADPEVMKILNEDGVLRTGFLHKQKRFPVELPITVQLEQGEKGPYVRLNLRPDLDGDCQGKFYFPDHKCGEVTAGIFRITAVKEYPSYGFLTGNMVQVEAPEEEKLAQYLVENLREVEHCTLRFMSHPSCGSYVELKPKASSWNRDPDPDYLVYLDDKTQMLNALPYIYDLQGAQVTEVCSVRDFLCEGYCGCDYAQLQSKLSYPDGLEPWIFNLTIRSERSPKYISEEVEIGEELGLIELRRSMNIDFFRVNQDALMTATISMTLEEFETMANDVRQVNENACARIRAMLKKGKLKIS